MQHEMRAACKLEPKYFNIASNPNNYTSTKQVILKLRLTKTQLAQQNTYNRKQCQGYTAKTHT